MSKLFMITILSIVILFQKSAAQKDTSKRAATCFLTPDANSGVSGVVTFVEQDCKVTVNANVKGLSAGKHGIHIHEFGDLSGGCKSTGGHYNPFKRNHGGPFDRVRHVGDMGNIDSDGVNDSVLNYVDPVIRLRGDHSIIGRAVVVHADQDDFGQGTFNDSMTTGHAGMRLACCVIGVKQV